MDAWAKLLTAVAAFIGAIAWPATLLVIVFVFRDVLRTVLSKITIMFDRITKASIAGVVLDLDKVANAELESGANKEGKITATQVEAAARIAVETRELNTGALLSELDLLCSEYDEIRRTLPSGDARTRAMTRIVIKMRSLAPRLFRYLDVYKTARSAGSRLAAIAMMQMVPTEADIDWLADRFSVETPFLFYQAALALQNLASNRFCSFADLKKIQELAVKALATVRNFSGPQDQNTIDVLETLILNLPEFLSK